MGADRHDEHRDSGADQGRDGETMTAHRPEVPDHLAVEDAHQTRSSGVRRRGLALIATMPPEEALLCDKPTGAPDAFDHLLRPHRVAGDLGHRLDVLPHRQAGDQDLGPEDEADVIVATGGEHGFGRAVSVRSRRAA
jgi:hypothetical protein